ncbi:MAG TPA: L,D-transpeptidase [Solirubrobacteraceae bacterium]|nr:L,D-transpeptidase [Solirubrobacteraceae bacterium]
MTRRGLLRIGLVVSLATAVFVVLLLRPAAHNPRAPSEPNLPNLSAGPQPAFAVGRPQLLQRATAASRWATVGRPVTALRAPGGRPVTRLAAVTPEGTTNLVDVLGSVWHRGVEWVHVRLPLLPNNTTGWVPRSALGGYHFVTTHLVVSLHRLRATLWKDGRVVFSAPVGVGQPQSPTPRGEFYIRDELTGYASPFYGPVAFGTSARSAVLTEWPDGGFVGIHGTDEPGWIPGRVSHGCIRLRNRDILRLARLLPVGTPLTIT